MFNWLKNHCSVKWIAHFISCVFYIKTIEQLFFNQLNSHYSIKWTTNFIFLFLLSKGLNICCSIDWTTMFFLINTCLNDFFFQFHYHITIFYALSHEMYHVNGDWASQKKKKSDINSNYDFCLPLMAIFIFRHWYDLNHVMVCWIYFLQRYYEKKIIILTACWFIFWFTFFYDRVT